VSPDPALHGFDDLARLVEAELTDRSTLVAQSMGGIVVVRVALLHPDRVQRLVLVATSGVADAARLGEPTGVPTTRPTIQPQLLGSRTTGPTTLTKSRRSPLQPSSFGAIATR